MDKYAEVAYAAALTSPGIGGRKNNSFRLGSVIVKRNRIIAVRCNLLKTHPKLKTFYTFPFLHAESAAIIAAGEDNCENCKLYIIRVRRDGSLGIAKPCNSCIMYIKKVGIKTIYYSTYENIVKEEL